MPKSVLERLGVKAGDQVEFVEYGQGIVLLRFIAHDIRALKGNCAEAGESPPVGTYEPGDHEDGAAMTVVRCPLFTDPNGDIRVRGTRVTLDAIVTAFRAGATAEEIAQKFPTVAPTDVYQIIAYYLNHTTEIDAYLSQRETTAAALKSKIEKRLDLSAFALACWRVVTLDTPIRRLCDRVWN